MNLNISWTTSQDLKKPDEILQAVVKTYSQLIWLHYWVVKLTLGLVSFTLTNQLEGDIKELVTLCRKSGVHQWGTQSSRLWDKGGGSPKKLFQPFGPQFGLKIRGAWPPVPLPSIRHCTKALVSWSNPTRGEVRSKMGQSGCIACLNMLTSNLTSLVPRQYNKTIHPFLFGWCWGRDVSERNASISRF